MDLSKLKTSDWIIGVSGIVLFIASFLDWFSIEAEDDVFGSGELAAGNGWDVGFLWGGLPALIGLAMVAFVAIRAFAPQVKLPEAPWGTILLVAGVIAAVLVVLKLIIGEDEQGFGDVININRDVGIFLAALAAIGLAVGGWFKFQEDKAGGAMSGPTTPPTPF